MGVAQTQTRRTGLLGGSFDPVHYAHLALAQTALDHLGLDHVELIPAAEPWQRQPLGAPAADRLAMLRLALDGQSDLHINPIELERDGPTYTVDTLRLLGAGEDPTHEYTWLLGSDQLINFCTWQGWREIVRRVVLAVARRPGSEVQAPAELAAELAAQGRGLRELPFAPSALSATSIRQRIAAGLPLDGLTPPAVAHYIQTHRLYRA